MTNNSAEMMRNYLSVVESSPNLPEEMDEAFPILKQALKSKWTGFKSKFSHRAKGEHQVQQAMAPFLKMFATYMGRKQQNWDNVTWRTIGNFVTGPASEQLPMGDFAPQRLTKNEFLDMLKNPQMRQAIASYLGDKKGQLNNLIPLAGIMSKLDKPVSQVERITPALGSTPAKRSSKASRKVSTPVSPTSGAPALPSGPSATPGTAAAPGASSVPESIITEDASLSQKLITGILFATVMQLMDKAEGTSEFDTDTTTNEPTQPGAGITRTRATPIQSDADIQWNKLTPAQKDKVMMLVSKAKLQEDLSVKETRIESMKPVLKKK